MRIPLIMVWLCLICAQLRAQDQPVTGRVYALNSRTPLAGIMVVNPAMGRQTRTDSTGFFRLPARKGNLLIFSGSGYRTDTVLVIDHLERAFFMSPPTHALKEVLISSAAPKLGELRDPDYRGQTVVYQLDEDENPVGGLVFRISYWNKDSKRERRSKKRLARAELETEIYELFSPDNIGKYIPLKGADLQQFIDLYRPAAELYRSGRFDLVWYLNDKYREYLTLPEEKRRLPPLKGF